MILWTMECKQSKVRLRASFFNNNCLFHDLLSPYKKSDFISSARNARNVQHIHHVQRLLQQFYITAGDYVTPTNFLLLRNKHNSEMPLRKLRPHSSSGKFSLVNNVHTLLNSGWHVDDVGFSISHNPLGLHGLLQGLIFLLICCIHCV
jgi:hypothetical protein